MALFIAVLMLSASLVPLPPVLRAVVQDDEVVAVRADGGPVGEREAERFEGAKEECTDRVAHAIPHDIRHAALYDENPIALTVTASMWMDCMEKQMNAGN